MSATLVDFSGNASVYDRRHAAVLAEEAARRLVVASAILPGHRVLDIGAGTGRVAIPFAERGCDVVALDPSTAMLDRLRAKARELPIRCLAAEGARLPFPAGHFDVVVIARVLYLAADWRTILHEARRVLSADGRLLHEWANGDDSEEWVLIREKARALFQSAGVASPFHPGVRMEREVDDELIARGFVRSVEVALGPGPGITLAEFLRRLTEGEFSYIWNVPRDVQDTCLPKLKAWSAETFDLERSIAMPRELRWVVYRSTDLVT
jgi:SAM-dependent methyltransferase